MDQKSVAFYIPSAPSQSFGRSALTPPATHHCVKQSKTPRTLTMNEGPTGSRSRADANGAHFAVPPVPRSWLRPVAHPLCKDPAPLTFQAHKPPHNPPSSSRTTHGRPPP